MRPFLLYVVTGACILNCHAFAASRGNFSGIWSGICVYDFIGSHENLDTKLKIISDNTSIMIEDLHDPLHGNIKSWPINAISGETIATRSAYTHEVIRFVWLADNILRFESVKVTGKQYENTPPGQIVNIQDLMITYTRTSTYTLNGNQLQIDGKAKKYYGVEMYNTDPQHIKCMLAKIGQL